MANPQNPHDKYFRSSMQNSVVAQQFFQYYLPAHFSSGLNFKEMTLENSTYIDDTLQETISDLVFSCPYSKDIGDKQPAAKLILLVEHQSHPDKLMPFRVFHYLFNLLYNYLKQNAEQSKATDKLPAVYAMVFYHGKQSPYPYTLNLIDCFIDPLNVMQQLFTNPIKLIDVNLVQDDEIQRQKLLGIMTGALKHSRDRDIKRFLSKLSLQLNSMDLTDDLALELLRTTLNYLVGVGNVANFEQFIQQGQQLAEPIRGEFMTIAEELQAMGAEKARDEARKEAWAEARIETEKVRAEARIETEKALELVAIKLLKENAAPRFVERIIGLELSIIKKLQAELETKD